MKIETFTEEDIREAAQLAYPVWGEGHACVGLIVDNDNPQAENLYSALGFERVGTRLFFGHQMWHLQRTR